MAKSSRRDVLIGVTRYVRFQKKMKRGDVVEVEMEGSGIPRNPIAAAKA